MLLSILVPTVPERSKQFANLFDKLTGQAVGKPVEILSVLDNRTRSIGAKRQALLDISRGKYVAFVDDDDDVSADYVTSLLDAAESSAHVLSFRQKARWNSATSEVHFSVQHQDEAFQDGGITKRFPWHVCAWRSDIAKRAVYSDKNWGEDADWVAQLKPLRLIEAHIPRVLHYYTHTDEASLALTPAPR